MTSNTNIKVNRQCYLTYQFNVKCRNEEVKEKKGNIAIKEKRLIMMYEMQQPHTVYVV